MFSHIAVEHNFAYVFTCLFTYCGGTHLSHVCSHIAAEHMCFSYFSYLLHILRRNSFFTCFQFYYFIVYTCFHILRRNTCFSHFSKFFHFNYVSRFPALHRFEHCNTSLNTINNEQMSKVSVLSVSSESVPSESESESRASESRASESEPDSENLMLYKYTTFLGLPRECHIQNLHEQLAICQNPVVMEFWSSRQIVQKRSGMRFINIYTTTITKSQDY
jgi:hypothetical protein